MSSSFTPNLVSASANIGHLDRKNQLPPGNKLSTRHHSEFAVISAGTAGVAMLFVPNLRSDPRGNPPRIVLTPAQFVGGADGPHR